MQNDLDTYIAKKHNLIEKDLFEERFLALLVELGELANETRCFKFWSTKERSNESVILEEYVDNIHFLLSIGLHKGYEFSHIDSSVAAEDETEHFNNVFEKYLALFEKQNIDNCLKFDKECI